ncbi:MAG: class I SAM-dependent methyltransferase [Armatimonadetes bacterium]|nr:class I SAM-dependent methyltransferase [Armatimonadota bacterium]
MLPPTQRFSDRVADYVRYRPSYPADLVRRIMEIGGLNEGSVVADVGCGTGIFAQLLLDTGVKVFGVEPNAPMMEAAVNQLGGYPKFAMLNGTAERTGLTADSVDAITAAQAFHWFDQEPTRAEFRRILKPRGWVFLLWNERDDKGSEFSRLYEQALLDCAPEYAKVGHRNTPDDDVLAWFQNPAATLERFDNSQFLDLDSFLGRAYSSSYVPAAGTAEREAITARLTDVFERCQSDGLIELKYETKLYYGQLDSLSA